MEKQFLDLYKEAKDAISASSADIFNKGRNEAALLAQSSDFPSKRTEEYLYCPLFDALKVDWGFNANRLHFGINTEDMFRCSVPGIKSMSVYLVNDVWIDNNDEISLGDGAFVCSMRHASKAHAGLLEKYYDTILARDNDGFLTMNRMLVQDGVLVYVPENTTLRMPLQFINMMRAGQPLMAFNRNLMIVGNNAKVQIIDCDHSMDNNPYFASRIAEIFVGENAELEYCAMESTHSEMNNLRRYAVAAGRDAKIRMSFFGLVNGNTRNHVEVDLNGEGAEVWLGGMLLGDKEQKTENYTIVRHHKPRCHSEELYKYILDDNAIGGFSGRIVVDHGAQKTESYQTNRNILISQGAKVLGRPQLEIYADDVKCGHGATTGMLDEAALFYMQQRGIGLKEARTLLLQAFSTEVVDHSSLQPLNDRLHLLIDKRLRGEEMRCAGCSRK